MLEKSIRPPVLASVYSTLSNLRENIYEVAIIAVLDDEHMWIGGGGNHSKNTAIKLTAFFAMSILVSCGLHCTGTIVFNICRCFSTFSKMRELGITLQSTHSMEIAIFWRTLQNNGKKISPAW